ANLAQADPERFADGVAAILNAKLALPSLQPIDDHDPGVTARLARLLDDARAGTLQPKDFAYMRAGFFPNGATRFAERLRALGPVQRLQLVSRVEQGDDRVFTYEVA